MCLGVYFINVLRAPFLYKSLWAAFFYLLFGFEFLAPIFHTKNAHIKHWWNWLLVYRFEYVDFKFQVLVMLVMFKLENPRLESRRHNVTKKFKGLNNQTKMFKWKYYSQPFTIHILFCFIKTISSINSLLMQYILMISFRVIIVQASTGISTNDTLTIILGHLWLDWMWTFLNVMLGSVFVPIINVNVISSS